MVTNVPMILKFLHPTAIPNVDFRINRRAGEDAPFTIVAWDAAKLGPQPTPEQLAEVEASQEFRDWLVEAPKQKKKQQVRESLNATDVESVRLRAILKLMMSVLIETRATINAMSKELHDNGLPVTPTKLVNRSWEQLEQAIATIADVEVELETTEVTK